MFHRKTDRMKVVLGESSRITGNLESPGTIFADGEVCGDVVGAKVILGEHSHIRGNIKAGDAIVGGRVDGQLSCSEKVEIRATGRVDGDIATKILVISEGGVFNGASRMDGGAAEDNHGDEGKIVEFSVREQQ